ncbi:coiled-coil domain-containing protein [Sphingobium ummariense]
MSGGSTIIEFWRDDQQPAQPAPASEDVLLLKQAVLDIEEDSAEEEAGRDGTRIARFILIGLGMVWLALAAWTTWRAPPATAQDWLSTLSTLLIPLLLLGIAYLLLARNSRAESRRFLDTARALRTEADLLELRLGRIATQLETARRSMQEQAELLDSYGAAASSNMEASAELIAGRSHSAAERAETAERAALGLVEQMNTLLDRIPALEERTSGIAAQIMDNGHALSERIDTLEARLHALAELSDEARARTLSATKSLSNQLHQLQEATRSASDEVSGLAELASGRIEATAQGARTAMDASRAAIEDHSAALGALVERAQEGIGATSGQAIASLSSDLATIEEGLQQRLQDMTDRLRATMAAVDADLASQREALDALVDRTQAHMASLGQTAAATLEQDLASAESGLRRRLDATLAAVKTGMADTDAGLSRQTAEINALVADAGGRMQAIGQDTIEGLAHAVAGIEDRLRSIDALLQGQKALTAELHSTLADAAETADERFARLEQTALARSARLTDALANLTAETQRIDSALAAGGVTGEKLIACAETLLVALDSSVRELDETYPAALTRFEARLERSQNLLASTAPEMERLEAISEAFAGRTQEAEEMLRGQGARLTEWLESTQNGLEANRQLVERLRGALDDAHKDANRITEGAAPLLVTALLRVKETAEQAAERARQALGRAIPDAAQSLADASEVAMRSVMEDRIMAQIQQVAAVAEEAVKAAHHASDRLMRQLLTIADTSANVEKRIEDAEREAQDRDLDHFARRSAVLIESLNSTAIDVTKILSNDVTDAEWAAYLKGDRGVFTRRAVRLLDAGESREIALHYDEDAEFREHVNRYIHDFESMLRVILSARDGNALGVAILSSDMGKLYVALAQAIERLRQ